jgi:hypothetical protein
MANPRVRPFLHFYPEDSGKTVNEYWQASQWHKETEPIRLPPMAVIRGQHYYSYEPCLLKDGSVCIPTNWFIYHGRFFAKAWLLQAVSSDTENGWIVDESKEIKVSQDDFLVSFVSWDSSSSTYGLPSPTKILGEIYIYIYSFIKPFIGSQKRPNDPFIPWAYTDPKIGNHWRALAKGAHVYSFPIWLYCDDTSGNLTKKWNKHNSFLFTPAGLP